MIEQKTIFVVGGGASTNFKLPSGADLKSDIASLMTFDVPDPWNVSGRFQLIFSQLKYAQQQQTVAIDDLDDALTAAPEIRAAMPLALSIDNYWTLNALCDCPSAPVALIVSPSNREGEPLAETPGPRPSTSSG